MTDYEDLIQRLEKAEGPDRELDAQIYASIGAVASEVVDPIIGTEIVWIFNGSIGHPPKFSASLDAAVGLVPEGWVLDHLGDDAAGTPAYMRFMGAQATVSNGKQFGEGMAPTRPIALCIAALKARAQASEEG